MEGGFYAPWERAHARWDACGHDGIRVVTMGCV